MYSILAKLDRFGRRTSRELASLLVMDRSTLGHLLRPLGDATLVKISLHQGDGASESYL